MSLGWSMNRWDYSLPVSEKKLMPNYRAISRSAIGARLEGLPQGTGRCISQQLPG